MPHISVFRSHLTFSCRLTAFFTVDSLVKKSSMCTFSEHSVIVCLRCTLSQWALTCAQELTCDERFRLVVSYSSEKEEQEFWFGGKKSIYLLNMYNLHFQSFWWDILLFVGLLFACFMKTGFLPWGRIGTFTEEVTFQFRCFSVCFEHKLFSAPVC